MPPTRWRPEKFAVVSAAVALAWVVGATMLYRSGGINTAGLLPTAGCLVALWGAVVADTRLMWIGTGVVVLAAVALIFSVGLAVAPAAIALIAGCLALGQAGRIAAEPD